MTAPCSDGVVYLVIHICKSYINENGLASFFLTRMYIYFVKTTQNFIIFCYMYMTEQIFTDLINYKLKTFVDYL